MNRRTLESHHPERRDFCEATRQKINRARVRLGMEQARPREEINEDVHDEAGDFAHDPSDDELILPVSHETLVASSSFPK